MSGIYRLTLSPTHFYVGRSRDIGRRVRDHRGLLARGKHPNAYMQNVYDLHHQFGWTVIQGCEDVEESTRVEQDLLDRFLGTEGCLNLAPTAVSGPGMHTEGTKDQIRVKRSHQVYTVETRQKLSAALMGNQRAKGHKHHNSEETRRKLSEVQRGKTFTNSHRQALSKAWESRPPITEATRKKLSAAQKARWERARRVHFEGGI